MPWKELLERTDEGRGPLPTPFAEGTKTMRHIEMDSANKRHADAIAADKAMQSERIAWDKDKFGSELSWDKQKHSLEQELNWFYAYLKEKEHDLKVLEWEAYNEAAGTSFGGSSPSGYDQDYSVRDVFEATTRDERMTGGRHPAGYR